MRHASADPDRQPLHAAASSDRIQADNAAPFRSLRHDAGAADHGLAWVSESGIELQYPARLVSYPAWIGHIPFAQWLVEAVRPRALVELGVHTGNSYCAFLQAIQFLSLPAQCYGIDHWRGDQHSGFYVEDVYSELRAYHDQRYGAFSTLIRSTFEEALAYFPDDTVDLLHIDGLHTPETVTKDLSDWLPKMSARGVVLLHDINVREREFGVWRVWEDLTRRYETFAFVHSYGLGVAYVGSDPPPPALRTLLTLRDADSIGRVRTYFARLGTSLVDRFERQEAEIRAGRLPAVEGALEAACAEARRHADTADRLRADLDTSAARAVALERELEASRSERARARDASRAELARELDASRIERARELDASRTELARQGESLAALQQDLAAARADTARHLDLVAAAQRERVTLRAEAARRVEEAERLRRELAAARAEAACRKDAIAVVEQELDAARVETARIGETVGALQRELDAARADTARQLAAVDSARSSAEAANQQIAVFHAELARTRGQVSAALAERERATLLLRDQLATTAALRREMAALREKT